eukprot:530685_1
MLPMTICCTSCGEYLGRGTKFNGRVEEAIGMNWLGLKRYRQYINCRGCSQEMTYITDPENDHYVTEHGCTTNMEQWRMKQDVNKMLSEKQKQMESDAIKMLENKSHVIKNQSLMDSISDLKHINKLNKKRSFDEINSECQQIEEFKQKRRQKIIKELKFNQSNNIINNFSFKPIITNDSNTKEQGLTKKIAKNKKSKHNKERNAIQL